MTVFMDLKQQEGLGTGEERECVACAGFLEQFVLSLAAPPRRRHWL